MKPIIYLIVILLTSITMYGAKLVDNVKSPKIKVTFLDVGQGDAEIIQDLSTNKVIVVDTGVRSSGIVEYLKSQKIKTINLLILTHPHSDHIGAATKLIKNFEVKRVLEPGFTHGSRTYQKLLQKIKDDKIPYTKGVVGQNFSFGDAKINLLAPPRKFISGTRSDANSNSLIFILTLKNFKTYFAADSEHQTESFILKNHSNIKSDILKVAHHGSRHATSDEFLDAVTPKIAVISAGQGNSYGHPSSKVIKQFKERKIKTYITFNDGTIIANTDGDNFSIKTVKTGKSNAHNSLKDIEQDDPDNYQDIISNKKRKKGNYIKAQIDSNGKAIIKDGYFYSSKSSKKFYAWNCKGIKRIKPSNLLEFDSYQAAADANRTLASRCKYDSSKEVKKDDNSMNFSLETNKKKTTNNVSSNSGNKININTASIKELTSLKGIGKKTAEKILNYRKHNKFMNISDLKKVKGIGKGKFNKIKDSITVN